MWNARLDSSNRRRDLLHNGRFAMFSLFTKATQLADVRIEDWPDPEDEINEKELINLARLLFGFLDANFRMRAKAEMRNGTLTATNYTKNANMMSDLLDRRMPAVIVNSARRAMARV